MNASETWTILLATALLNINAAHARPQALELQYKSFSGQTNVYQVEVKVRAEAGEQTVGGNLFVVSANADSNVFQYSCHATFKVRNVPEHTAFRSFGYFGGAYASADVWLPSDSEVQFDKSGRVLRVVGDYPLPIPLGGLLLELVPRLPESPSGSRWETTDESFVMDHPYWLGPADGFFYWDGFGFILNPQLPQYRITPAVVAVTRHVAYQVVATTQDVVTIHEQLTLTSHLSTGSEHRLASTGQGDLVFDRTTSMFREIAVEGNTLAVTKTSALNAKTSLRCRLLQGAELAAALAPPPPNTPPVFRPTTQEWAKMMSELQSADVLVRQAASCRLRDAELDSPSEDLLASVASFSTNADTVVRQNVSSFLMKYGTTNQVPTLLALFKDPEYWTHEKSIKALGRIKDPRAIQPLVDDVARGGQSAELASSALANIGPVAEDAVLQLLKERSVEVRRLTCGILKQIGTSKSIEPLLNLTGDRDQGVSESAADALRVIKSRE